MLFPSSTPPTLGPAMVEAIAALEAQHKASERKIAQARAILEAAFMDATGRTYRAAIVEALEVLR